jgi:hypothetical protein
MSERRKRVGRGGRRVSRNHWPPGLRKRLSQSGYEVIRVPLNLPTWSALFDAIERGDTLTIIWGWRIRKKRQRSFKRAQRLIGVEGNLSARREKSV